MTAKWIINPYLITLKIMPFESKIKAERFFFGQIKHTFSSCQVTS